MPHPLVRFFSGLSGRSAVQAVSPRWTFTDVILPPSTRRALDRAIAQVTSHDVVFRQWGLGERHRSGLALTFHFAGPPGTGKTICADAIAAAVNRTLLVVHYAELESMWLGETPKQVAAVFRRARESNSVLFFDEADAIASRRSNAPDLGGVIREANTVVNVLLQELETFTGVVIFATNMAANLDPAFERRIRTHVLFEPPGVKEREQIWRVQMHPTRTPLAADVDFQQLAERYEATGGEIRNAVLNAAVAAASEAPSPESAVIRQRHLDDSMRDVIDGRQVMRQTIGRREPIPGEDARQRLGGGERLMRTLVVAVILNAAALLVGAIAVALALW